MIHASVPTEIKGIDKKPEMVNHPSHYQSKKGIEVIDVMEAFTEDLSGVEAVNTSQAIKYILRWDKKNGAEDVEKAIWYLNRLLDHLKNKEKEND